MPIPEQIRQRTGERAITAPKPQQNLTVPVKHSRRVVRRAMLKSDVAACLIVIVMDIIGLGRNQGVVMFGV